MSLSQRCITYPQAHGSTTCITCKFFNTYLLHGAVLLEQLTGLQLVKKFPAFHGTRRFITALTRVRHLSPSWASSIQSTYPHPTSWRPVLIKFFNIHRDIIPSTTRFSKWPLSSRLPTKILFIFSLMSAKFSAHLFVRYLILVEA